MSEIKSDLFSKSVPNRQFKHLEVGAEDSNEVVPQHTSVNTQFDQPMDYEAINAVLRSRGQAPIGPESFAPQAPVNAPSTFDSFKEARQEIHNVKKSADRITPSAKARIEALCGMFSKERVVDVGEMRFKLKTLTGKKMKEVMLSMPPAENVIELSFSSRSHFLAGSIIEIDDIDFDIYIEAESFQDRVDFIDNLPEVIVERLHREYQATNKEINDKYGMASSMDVQEVISDLKK